MSRIDNFFLFNLTLHGLLLSEFARMRSRCLADSYRSRWNSAECFRGHDCRSATYEGIENQVARIRVRSDKPLKVDFRELVRMARTALFALPLAP